MLQLLIAIGGLTLLAHGIAAVLNRARTPDHDIRRRALAIVAGVGAGSPVTAALVAPPPWVLGVSVIASSAVVVAGLWLVLAK